MGLVWGQKKQNVVVKRHKNSDDLIEEKLRNAAVRSNYFLTVDVMISLFCK